MSDHLRTARQDVPKLEPALRLLLVDDDPVVLEALHLKLEADGLSGERLVGICGRLTPLPNHRFWILASFHSHRHPLFE
jgi:hypothetical protein